MIQRPIIILGAPRSGTTILTRCLSLHPDLWHLESESHNVLEGPFHPSKRQYESNRVLAEDVTEDIEHYLRAEFYRLAINLNTVSANPATLLAANGFRARVFTKMAKTAAGRISSWKKPGSIRLLEKTPKNTLRVPMLDRLFPDAFYVWLRRNAADNIDSLTAAWHAVDRIGPVKRPRYAGAGYPIADRLALRDYHGKWWKFALVPEWQKLKEMTVADVAAWQYYQCNHFVLKDLASIGERRIFPLHHEEFVRDPVGLIEEILEWADLKPSRTVRDFAQRLPRINESTPGRRKKGLRHPEAVSAAIAGVPEIGLLHQRMGYGDFAHA